MKLCVCRYVSQSVTNGYVCTTHRYWRYWWSSRRSRLQASIVAGVVVVVWWRDNRKRHQRSGDMFAITGCAILHVVVPGVVVGIAVVVVVIVA